MTTKLHVTAGFALVCGVLASCTPSGYYDSTGQYRSYGASDSFNHDKPMAGTPVNTVPGGTPASTTYVNVPASPMATTTVVNHPDGSATSYVTTPATTVPATTTVTTTPAGHYDENGNYIVP